MSLSVEFSLNIRRRVTHMTIRALIVIFLVWPETTSVSADSHLFLMFLQFAAAIV